MKYFIDTEFIEGFKKPFKWLPTIGGFNKPYHLIQLVSIGIISEDGRTYYAVSNEFNPKDADSWVKDNVLLPIYQECVSGDMRNHALFSTKRNRYVTWGRGKSNKQIASEIFNFINPDLGFPTSAYNNSELKKGGRLDDYFNTHNVKEFDGYFYAQPEFYAYYADYDWVVFCSLFGKMIDLPKGFPMYCKDLKQTLDEYVENYDDKFSSGKESFETKLEWIKNKSNYPKQQNEHNALADAKWNFELYKFLQNSKQLEK